MEKIFWHVQKRPYIWAEPEIPAVSRMTDRARLHMAKSICYGQRRFGFLNPPCVITLNNVDDAGHPFLTDKEFNDFFESEDATLQAEENNSGG